MKWVALSNTLRQSRLRYKQMLEKRKQTSFVNPPAKDLQLWQEINRLIARRITELYDGTSKLNILEAGCGQRWSLQMNEVKYILTGVDLDRQALDIRVNKIKDLDKAIQGDLQTLELDNLAYDVIYSAFVLEHVEKTEQVLDKFARWLKPGGIIILHIPHWDTVHGFFTRVTPFWFHVLYYRYIEGKRNAGKPGFGPYPVYYNRILSQNGIRQFCKNHQLKIIDELVSSIMLNKQNGKTKIIKIFSILVSILSLGRLPWRPSTQTYVIKKEPGSA